MSAAPAADGARCDCTCNVGTTCGMKAKPRKSTDLTIRLTPEERREIDRAAGAEHLSSSTWLRRLALLASEDRKQRDAQRERMALLAARIREGKLAPAPDHAAEVERSRSEGWKR